LPPTGTSVNSSKIIFAISASPHSQRRQTAETAILTCKSGWKRVSEVGARLPRQSVGAGAAIVRSELVDGKKKVAVIGFGAMARNLRAAFTGSGGVFDITAALVSETSALDASQEENLRVFHDPLALIEWEPSLVVECASHSAVRNSVPVLLRAGIDTVIVSIGSLSDPLLRSELEAAALVGNSRLTVASGAIGGLDVLRAGRLAGLSSVEYVGTKPPAAWRGSAAETLCDLSSVSGRTIFFEGNAEEASRLFPKNANVTAAVALAGIGFEKTKVTLVADAQAHLNSHSVTACGAFGDFSIYLNNQPLAQNPKTSRLAALSIEQAIIRHFELVEM
jgi:aspartate dehydrogenase